MSVSEGWNTGAPSGGFFAKQENVNRTRTLPNILYIPNLEFYPFRNKIGSQREPSPQKRLA
jgi:hypothetical protein